MVSTQEDFIRYIACFNNKDYEPQHAFYADNVEFTLPNLPPLYGSAAVQKHYDFVHGLADETLDVISILFDRPVDPTKIFYENNSWFRFKRDHEHSDPCPGKKDDLAKITVWIIYELDSEHKFSKITCNALKVENFGNIPLPPPAEGAIRPF